MPYQAVQFRSPRRVMEPRLLATDDARVLRPLEQRDYGVSQEARTESVRFERPAELRVQVGVFLDNEPRVVEQDVEAAESLISITLAATAIEASVTPPRRLSVPGGLAG